MLSLALRGDSGLTDQQVLAAVVPLLQAANDNHFGGRGRIVDNSSRDGGDVMLVVEESDDGFSITVASHHNSDFTLDASSPCR